ncbi:MAG: T9SS type A sorting domain-containing protein, partial [Flavobacteriales bacterium]|nr:T9SS type A sorting domain-containing protein [Flavobacteriales bacterium]
VNFTDLSANAPTSWIWSFTGGNPGSSFDQNPSNIQYNNASSYEVSLLATNAFGSDTLVKTAYIVVNSIVGITDFNTGPRNVKISPNPFTESTLLEFENKSKEHLSLTIYDGSGRLVREYHEINTESLVIERDGLSSGSYYFQLEGNSGRDAGKFIIE